VQRNESAADAGTFSDAEAFADRTASRPVSPEAVARAAELLGEALHLMGIEATVTEEAGALPGDIVLQVDGEASGVVIGRHGQGLDAIEYILNRMVARQFTDSGHIVVDAASYRARRRQNLVDMARRMADKAKRERRTVTLSPLSPRDRRIVHLALQEDREVTTRSQGEGLHRKLLIIPQGGGRRHGGRYQPR
jgi:spoIIIJ-associated protein